LAALAAGFFATAFALAGGLDFLAMSLLVFKIRGEISSQAARKAQG